jgi:hypothetical protein
VERVVCERALQERADRLARAQEQAEVRLGVVLPDSTVRATSRSRAFCSNAARKRPSAEQPGIEGDDGNYCDLINVAAQEGQHLVLLELLLRDYRETTDKSTADALNSALKEAVEMEEDTLEPSYREADRVKCAHLLLAFGADPRALTLGTTETALQCACTDALRGALFDRAAVEVVKCSSQPAKGAGTKGAATGSQQQQQDSRISSSAAG